MRLLANVVFYGMVVVLVFAGLDELSDVSERLVMPAVLILLGGWFWKMSDA